MIAIISLLVSILLPSLNKAKELARRTACAANLHNIALGSVLYAEEQAGRLPTPKSKWVPEAYDLVHLDELAAILLNQLLGQDTLVGAPGTLQDFPADMVKKMVWRCPSQEVDRDHESLYYYDPYGRFFRTYSYMMLTGLRQSDKWRYHGALSPTTVDDPIGPLAADVLGSGWYDPSNFSAGGYHKINSSAYNGVAGINQAWSDGHVQWVNMGEFPEGVPIDGWMYTICDDAPRYCWIE